MTIRVVGERCHNYFRTGYQTHHLGYMGFGLGITFAQQKKCWTKPCKTTKRWKM
jgi:hypothetical protein